MLNVVSSEIEKYVTSVAYRPWSLVQTTLDITSGEGRATILAPTRDQYREIPFLSVLKRDYLYDSVL